MKTFIIVALYIILRSSGSCVFAQINKNEDHAFLLKVKLIDEFIERFNLEEDAFLFKHADIPEFTTSHKNILLGLFNQYQEWDSTLVKGFVEHIINSHDKNKIGFSDKDWFVETKTSFQLHENPVQIKLFLKYESIENKGDQWSIKGVDSDQIFSNIKTNKYDTLISVDTLDPNSIIKLDGSFIRPASHHVNFMDFLRVFRPGNDWENIISSSDNMSKRSYFLALIDYEILKYIQNDGITFHFLQIDEWIFQVKYFNREDTNSGWLISKLMKAEQKDKEDYLKKYIYDNE